MKYDIQSPLNPYLDEILEAIKKFADITLEQQQSALSILKGFMENLQSGRLPFRDLEKYNSKEIFEQIPGFRQALGELFQFQRAMKNEDKQDFLAVTNAYLASHPLNDSAQIKKTSTLLWLDSVLEQLVAASGKGGEVSVSLPEKNKVVVKVTGDLAVQYSARQFLSSFYSNPKDAPVITIPQPSQTTIYTFNEDILKAARREHHQLILLKELLATQGYEVEVPGKKDCRTQLFVDAKAVEECDEAKTIEQWGINLSVAEALKNSPGNAVFPFTAHLTVKNEAQRAQFKEYFTQVGILNFDKTGAKQFILNDMGEESFECNISLPNAKVLWDYFLRLDTMAATQKIPAEKIHGEDQLARLQRQTRSEALRALNERISTKEDKLSTSYSFFGQASAFTIAGEYAEDAYHDAFEKLVNQHCVRGPAAFHLMMNEPANFSSLAVATNHLTAALGTINRAENDGQDVSFEQAYQEEIAIGQKPCAAYAQYKEGFDKPFANKLGEYLVGLGQQITPKLLPQSPLTAERIQILKGKSKEDLHYKIADIENFFNVHSPYFFVKTVADKIEALLDSPDVTEEAIEQILTEYGVTDLEQYKIKGMAVFNTYHIKFSLLEIAFNACLQNGILFPFDALKSNPEGHAWVTNLNTRRTISQNSEWINAVEWNLNGVYPIGWVPGNREIDTTASRYAQQGNDGRSTYVGGRTSQTSRMFIPPTGEKTRDTATDQNASVYVPNS
jgi:hypothetical protein